MNLDQYRECANKLNSIRPLQSCPDEDCGSAAIRIVQVEPLEGRSTLDVNRTCIVECGGCDTKYVSRYDS